LIRDAAPSLCRDRVLLHREVRQNVIAQTDERRNAAPSRPGQPDVHHLADSTWPRLHDHDAISEEHRFIDIVRDQDHRDALAFPNALQLGLHAAAGEGIERAKPFVEEQ
jgi:hypothetical protein